MVRLELIQRILRDVYGGEPTDDANITNNLVNSYINDGIALAAKQHYKENIQIDGIAFLNNSFYTTFKGLAITEDSGYTGYWKCTLPEIPFGLGKNEGIKSIKILSTFPPTISNPVFILDSNEWEIADDLPQPNGILAKNEGGTVYFKSNDLSILLYQNTATVTMVSGGDSTDLTSTLNVPQDYIPVIQQYVVQTLVFERAQKQDLNNDGADVAV